MASAYQADISLEEYPYKTGHAYGRCYETLRRLAPPAVCDVLARAGDTRLQQRVWRWSQRETDVGLAQAMYEAVLRALGSTGQRQRFQTLAQSVSWHELQQCLHTIPLQDHGLAAEALLLGRAGMLPHSGLTSTALDEETGQYVRVLQAHWRAFPVDIQQGAWHAVDWRQPHVRPTNTPERRLAGMARILAHYHDTSLLDAAVALCRQRCHGTDTRTARALYHALARLLDVPALSYWSRRAYLGGYISKAQRLIGRQRAGTVVVDAMLPILLVYAQRAADAALSDCLLACYHAAPCLPDNHVLRYMRHRMLGNDPALLVHITGARQQQGLLQLFTDFCGNDEGECQGCDFPLNQTVPSPLPAGEG